MAARSTRRARRQRRYQDSVGAPPPSTSARRARVAREVPSGSASTGKKPPSAISQSGARGVRLKGADDEARDMVAAAVAEQAVQHGTFAAGDAALLQQLAHHGRLDRFAAIDSAARQVPARKVGVADKEDGAAIEDDGADAERHRPRPPERGMQPAEDLQGTRHRFSLRHERSLPARLARVSNHGQASAPAYIPIVPETATPPPLHPRGRPGPRPASGSSCPSRSPHLSDAHIGPLPHARRRDLIGKRITGYINWKRGRSTAHDMEVLAAVVTDMRDQAPSHVAMTGDILNIGLPGEFPLAAAWLETLGEPGTQVSFVAGNHDAYTRGSLPTLARTFANWTRSDATGLPGYPFLKERGGVALIGLCSGVPRAPFIASGPSRGGAARGLRGAAGGRRRARPDPRRDAASPTRDLGPCGACRTRTERP